jgi:arsenite methyltransferase
MTRPDYLSAPAGTLPRDFAEAFDETSFWGARFGALLLDHLELKRGIAGLDIGCATGFPLIELAQMHGPSSRFIGIDIWAEALHRGRRKLGILGRSGVSLVQCDGAALPFDDASFDLITSNLGLNNFEKPEAVIGECFRVARPGARIALTTNLSGHMREVYALFEEILSEMRAEDAARRLALQEQHRGTRAGFQNMMTGAGFEISRSVESRLLLRFADGSAMLRHGLVKFFLDGWRPAIGAELEEEFFVTAERKLNELAGPSGLELAVPMLYLEGIRSGAIDG